MLGLDLSSLHIDRARRSAAPQCISAQRLRFECASFAWLKSSALRFSHIVSEAALNHCIGSEAALDALVADCRRCLRAGGRLLINDVVANRAPSAETRCSVYDRMGYAFLPSWHWLRSERF